MQFILGEKREIKIRVTSTKNDPFTIRNATFNLIRKGKGIAETGPCLVEGTEISALVQPKSDGSYILEFVYEIANEILKAHVPIEVEYYART